MQVEVQKHGQLAIGHHPEIVEFYEWSSREVIYRFRAFCSWSLFFLRGPLLSSEFQLKEGWLEKREFIILPFLFVSLRCETLHCQQQRPLHDGTCGDQPNELSPKTQTPTRANRTHWQQAPGDNQMTFQRKNHRDIHTSIMLVYWKAVCFRTNLKISDDVSSLRGRSLIRAPQPDLIFP